MKVWNGELYVGGYFNTGSGDPGNNIASWNGTAWSNPGGGLGVSSASVWALEEYQGNLWAGGVFGITNGGPYNVLAYWDGIQWHGSGLNISSTAILCLETGGNDLYVAGGNTTVNGTNVNCIFKYTAAVGIDESKPIHHHLSVNPNPATEKTIVKSLDGTHLNCIQIIDRLGRVIFEANNINSHTFELNVSLFASDIYLLKTTGTNGNLQGIIRLAVLR